MEKKCAMCDILLDVPCAHPGCAGHHNESRGDVCVYCATNERENIESLRTCSRFWMSSVAETGSDWTAQDERALLEISWSIHALLPRVDTTSRHARSPLQTVPPLYTYGALSSC